jgi:serine/threonine protein phosphatase PrpC
MSEILSIYNQVKPTHVVDINTKINQLSKGQDYIITDQTIDLETGEVFNWAAVFDGHGSNLCIDFIKKIPSYIMNDFIVSNKPIQSLAKYIDENLKNCEGSGSTMCLVKFYRDRIECFNCGDSQVVVFGNGNVKFISKEHNFSNKNERNRLTHINNNNNVTFIPSMNIKMMDNETLVSVYSEYIEWDDDCSTRLACSQSLGHNGVTGYAPDKTIIPISPTDNYKVIIGSDGLWDMVMMNDKREMTELYYMDADDIMKQTTDRWLQQWKMQDLLNYDTTIHHCSYKPSQCDDISVVVANIIPIIY